MWPLSRWNFPCALIRAYSYHGEVVLDPFMGSGTTLEAAARSGRNGIGYEINPSIAADAIRTLRSLERGAPGEGGP